MTSELAGAWFEREGVFPPAHGDGMAGSGFLKGVALPGDERLAPVRGIGLLRRLFRFMAHFEGCRLKDVGSIHQERLEGFAFDDSFFDCAALLAELLPEGGAPPMLFAGEFAIHAAFVSDEEASASFSVEINAGIFCFEVCLGIEHAVG